MREILTAVGAFALVLLYVFLMPIGCELFSAEAQWAHETISREACGDLKRQLRDSDAILDADREQIHACEDALDAAKARCP